MYASSVVNFFLSIKLRLLMLKHSYLRAQRLEALTPDYPSQIAYVLTSLKGDNQLNLFQAQMLEDDNMAWGVPSKTSFLEKLF